MKIRLLSNYGFALSGSLLDLPESEAKRLIDECRAVPDLHKDIDKPSKDKMVRKTKRK